jgi:hypothetical protein
MTSELTPPFDTEGIDHSENGLVLTYHSEREAGAARRIHSQNGRTVTEKDEVWMYNYSSEEWEMTFSFSHQYDLAPDEQTLVGDGSNWSGDGKRWREWFIQRHFKRLTLRFRHDSVEEPTAANISELATV